MAKKYRYGKATPCEQTIIFARVSTKEQEPNASLKAQKKQWKIIALKKVLGLLIVTKRLKVLPAESAWYSTKCWIL